MCRHVVFGVCNTGKRPALEGGDDRKIAATNDPGSGRYCRIKVRPDSDIYYVFGWNFKTTDIGTVLAVTSLPYDLAVCGRGEFGKGRANQIETWARN
jgi:hypothetical protein